LPRIDALARALEGLDERLSEDLLGEISEHGIGSQAGGAVRDLLERIRRRGTGRAEDLLLGFRDLVERVDRGAAPHDRAVSRYGEVREPLREIAGLLCDESVWDGVAVRTGRRAVLDALAEHGRLSVPVLGGEFSLRIDAPALVAAASVLGSRPSLPIPLNQAEVAAFSLRQAGRSLGLPDGPMTEAMVTGRLLEMAGSELRSELSERLSGTFDDLLVRARYERAEVASRILSGLPPMVADEARRRYGDGLEGLLPSPDTPVAAAREFVLTRVPDELVAFVRERFGADISREVGRVTGWAADLLRAEVNGAVLELMLASEELDRLSVDRGRKVGGLDVRMAMASFDRLDRRTRGRARSRLKAAASVLEREAGLQRNPCDTGGPNK
ncbi:MAG: hypothetical protein WC943_13670, partial [Elusimicrobiota bacterium]